MIDKIKSAEIINSLFEGVYLLDRDRVITYWNDAAERITGFKRHEVIGKACRDNILVHVDEQGNNLCVHNCPVSECMSCGEMREEEVFLHHKNGHRVPVSVRVSPIFGDNNEIIGSAEFFVDRTPYESCREQLEEAVRDSLIDSLTKLPNRRYLDSQLDIKIVELERINNKFGILMMDIDHFKEVNDNFGHTTGDEILIMVTKTLASASRPYDIVGRWGGEEFLAIIPNADLGTLSAIAARYRSLVEKSTLHKNNRNISVTISIGGVIVKKHEQKNTIVDRVDEELYKSKSGGRNLVNIDKS